MLGCHESLLGHKRHLKDVRLGAAVGTPRTYAAQITLLRLMVHSYPRPRPRAQDFGCLVRGADKGAAHPFPGLAKPLDRRTRSIASLEDCNPGRATYARIRRRRSPSNCRRRAGFRMKLGRTCRELMPACSPDLRTVSAHGGARMPRAPSEQRAKRASLAPSIPPERRRNCDWGLRLRR